MEGQSILLSFTPETIHFNFQNVMHRVGTALSIGGGEVRAARSFVGLKAKRGQIGH